MRLALGLVLVTFGFIACSASERKAETPASAPSSAPSSAPVDDRASAHEHCVAYGTDSSACSRDPRCLTRMVPACSRCDGGPLHCFACLDLVELEGFPAEACRSRAEGRHVEACRLMHPDRPERCNPR